MLHDLDTIASTQALYVMDRENRNAVIRCRNPLEWIEWMKAHATELEQTQLTNNRELITLFAGYCGEHHESRPFCFCTLMKPEPLLPNFSVVLDWYPTLQDATAGHQKIVERYLTVKQPGTERNPFGRKSTNDHTGR